MDSYLEKDVDISTVVRKICSLENETAGLLEAFYQRLGSEGTLAAKKIPLCIKRLSDGMDESDYGYEEVFTKGEIGRASQKLVFERLFIDKKMEEYAEPLLLISDEYEIDKNVENRIQARRSRGYRMFPVIIFPAGDAGNCLRMQTDGVQTGRYLFWKPICKRIRGISFCRCRNREGDRRKG